MLRFQNRIHYEHVNMGINVCKNKNSRITPNVKGKFLIQVSENICNLVLIEESIVIRMKKKKACCRFIDDSKQLSKNI
jgi:hypothetical protein